MAVYHAVRRRRPFAHRASARPRPRRPVAARDAASARCSPSSTRGSQSARLHHTAYLFPPRTASPSAERTAFRLAFGRNRRTRPSGSRAGRMTLRLPNDRVISQPAPAAASVVHQRLMLIMLLFRRNRATRARRLPRIFETVAAHPRLPMAIFRLATYRRSQRLTLALDDRAGRSRFHPDRLLNVRTLAPRSPLIPRMKPIRASSPRAAFVYLRRRALPRARRRSTRSASPRWNILRSPTALTPRPTSRRALSRLGQHGLPASRMESSLESRYDPARREEPLMPSIAPRPSVQSDAGHRDPVTRDSRTGIVSTFIPGELSRSASLPNFNPRSPAARAPRAL